MDETPRKPATAWQFIRAYFVRIVIGAVLLVVEASSKQRRRAVECGDAGSVKNSVRVGDCLVNEVPSRPDQAVGLRRRLAS